MAACNAIMNDFNQYAHPKGYLPLRQALSASYGPLFGRALCPENEILISAGANGGLYVSIAAFVNPGDEVIVFEPFFDIYIPSITLNGGVPIFCPIRQHQELNATCWLVDFTELRNKITSKTKAILLNTPHNPIGKVFTVEELLQISALAKEFNLLVFSDEVYDRLVYTDFHRIATLPGMWERTITIGSAGKSFCVTGWRVGWCFGPHSLIKHLLATQTRMVFCVNLPCQVAVATALQSNEAQQFFTDQVNQYKDRRNLMLNSLSNIGVDFTLPEGAYFILVDVSKIELPSSKILDVLPKVPFKTKDWVICYWLTTEIGVAAIPATAFYSEEHKNLASNQIRLCFCKDDTTLQLALKRLEGLKIYLR